MKGNLSFLNRTVRIFLSLLVAFSVATGSTARASSIEGPVPTLLSSSPSDWRGMEKKSLGPLLLWARIPSTMKDETVLSEVFRRIPNRFPYLQLNVLSRGLHSSILYLEGMSLEQLREMTQFFHNLDSKTLAEYDLLKPVTFFDPTRIEFEVVGTQSRFLALKPHPEFVAWQLRFWKMVGERGPAWLIEHHKAHRDLGDQAISESGVHCSLVQWEGKSGIVLSPSEIKKLEKDMREVFEESIQSLRERAGGHDPSPILFDWKEMPLQVSQPAINFAAGPFDILSIKGAENGSLGVSQVIRIRVPNEGEGQSKVVETGIADFLAKKIPATPSTMPNYLPGKRTWVNLSNEDFLDLLDDARVKSAYSKAKETLSPTWAPAIVPTLDFSRANRFYIGSETHPQLDPSKTFESLEMLSEIGFHSLPDVTVGMSVYASSARKEIRNPSDVDLMINALAWVPESVPTYEAAKASAVVSIRKLIEQIRDLDQQGRIAIAELRIGSDATMGYLSGDPIQDGLNNPYLSREDIHQGFYVDRFGKKWSLDELIALGDFTKFKIDFFRHGKRYPISLQIGYGFHWKGHAFHFNQNGSKGVQPNLRTAVYDGAESMAIALTLARPYAYYMVQKFPTLARAIGELRLTAKIDDEYNHFLWSPKFIKKFYNFLYLAQATELRMDEIFYQETSRALGREGFQAPQMTEVIDDILRAINTPELATLNALKRNVNDIREFNEFQHRFTPMQWTTRVSETYELLQELKVLLNTPRLNIPKSFYDELEEKMSQFERLFGELTTQEPKNAVISLLESRFHQPFLDFEKVLADLEAHIVTNGPKDVVLSEKTKRFIETFVRQLPESYYHYLMLRSQDAPQRMRWILKLMGFDPVQQDKIQQKVQFTSSSKKVSRLSKESSPCEGVFLQPLSGGLAW